MNTYECMYIIQSNLSDDETDKANERIVEEIEKRGGVIVQRERLGRKRLAYSIRRNDDGAYHLLYFELPPGEIASLRLAYRLHPRLLRILILRREPEEVAKLQRRRPEAEGPGAEAEAVEAPAESAPETSDDADEQPDSTGDDEQSVEPDEEPAEDETERQE